MSVVTGSNTIDSTILPHHLADLRRSGLNDATISDCGFRSESNYIRLAMILGWQKWPKRMGAALVIPFHGPNGENGYCRLKADTARKDRNGKQIKYESPRGHRNRIFIPPGTLAHLNEPTTELLITEGEKKSAKSDQEGFRCIGLVGVFGWKDGKSELLLPELEQIVWRGRQVRIVFDSDLAEKPEVQDAECRLAAQLKTLGANVRVVRLPSGAGGLKVGLDDFLISHGALELRRLLDAADDPVEVKGPLARVSAAQLDPSEEAKRYVEARWMSKIN